MILFVPLAGEINFYPINATFRVSLGPPVIFLFLLFLKNRTIIPGLLTALAVVAYRIFLDWMMLSNFNWFDSFEAHYPTFFFYFTYTCLFYLARVNRYHHRPLLIGFFGIVIEIISDLFEIFVQYLAFGVTISSGAWTEMLIISLSHSFMVLGVFSMMKLYETQLKEQEIKKQNEHMVMLISNLYEESIHLKKTLQNSETITRKAFNLYRELNQDSPIDSIKLKKTRQQLLEISGEVHEMKKDNQRIFAGLSKLIYNEGFVDYVNIDELIKIIVRANENYARLLEKDIRLTYTIQDVRQQFHVFTVLSILNNIVANAVEAIHYEGAINIDVRAKQHTIEFLIEDNGPGILEKHKELIFKPGFTSKFDAVGNPSTGIGLAFIKDMVTKLNGQVTFESNLKHKRTVFTIRLPIENLIKKEDS
ncbi:sensor histidine kinase [Halalkalibacter lacteus]|uniref:sensor histidine kinase n=1 Tax=Halalkalibacter lacteus TaxID=3090663 RepID=UPI003D6771F7